MENNNDDKKVTGMVFAGCMFVGMGIGWVLGKLVPGMFIGMGVGMLAGATGWFMRKR